MAKEMNSMPAPRSKAGYGWVPDLPDFRDFNYAAPGRVVSALPSSVDLRKSCPAVYDQKQLGSCTANALAAAFEFDLLKQKAPDFMPSRLFIYYNERAIEGSIPNDAGAQIRDGVKTLAKQGVCPEKSWPYNPNEFASKPHLDCYKDALTHQIESYQRISVNLTQMKGCLADGYPFVFGFTVYDSFEGDEIAKTGIMPMPQKGESVIGGHAVMAVGYDDKKKMMIVRNSWGTSWGIAGYFMMPYAYISNPSLASDFWTIRMVEANPEAKRKAKK